ncbi:hypothetical protein [Bosea massiliensis]|uniref:Uncharacterized protein n=1 Tax=Bosea massiliensis TaxID=151419 RepID=A0ABW0P3D4_9HYPH
MGKLIWYATSAGLVALLIWTALTSLRGDYDAAPIEQRRLIRSF